MFFSLEIILLLILVITKLVWMGVEVFVILNVFHVLLVINFLYSLITISISVRVAQIHIYPNGISGFTLWGKRTFIDFSSIRSVKTFNILFIKSLLISSENAKVAVPLYLAQPGQFYATIRDAAGSNNLLCTALEDLGYAEFSLDSINEKSIRKRSKKILAIVFGLSLTLFSALVWVFGISNVQFFALEFAPSNFMVADALDECSQISRFLIAWIYLVWSVSLLVGVIIPSVMIWRNVERKKVIIAVVLVFAQNVFSYLFGLPFLFWACL